MALANGNGHKPPRKGSRILNVLEQRYHPRFYETIAAIMSLRQTYLSNRFIFIPGVQTKQLLSGLGAREEDFSSAQLISDLTGPDPTLDYRSVSYGRYCIDPETRSIRRLEAQPYILTVEEDYKRHDSGVARMFDETPPAMQGNTVIQALLLLKAMIIHGVGVSPRDRLDYTSPLWVCTVFNARTHTAATEGLYGEPALEGVHSDGSDHSMTTFLGASNMRPDSAVTLLHDNQERTGVHAGETNPLLIRGRAHHRDFLDTLLFADHDHKHSVTSLYQMDEALSATRDMLVVFTRRPKVEGHVSGYVDVFDLHATEPLHLPMWLP